MLSDVGMTIAPQAPQAAHYQNRLRWRTWAILGVWLVFSTTWLIWGLHNIDQEAMELARQEARANFNKDQAFRVWATRHGGIYVPVTERTVPSESMAHIPERDITTPSGRHLTLMNPAYMLRQMMEDYDELYGVKGKITSLAPINRRNAADPWEVSALKRFNEGDEEVFEITQINGEPFFRLMRPMIMQSGCLKCHADQGRLIGEVYGGVGVSVPLTPYYLLAGGRKRTLWSVVAVLWILGSAGIWVWGRRDQQRLQERLAYEGRIWQQANFDTLTQLSNRNLFMDRLDRAVIRAHREHGKLALLFIDLDQFKDVNDTRGHHIGDMLLQEAAVRLRNCVRETDTVSRLGGDEFTVILSDISEGVSAHLVARSILRKLSEPFDIQGQKAHLSASIGITLYPQDGDDSTQLLKNADTAMYQAKDAGRNAFRYFTAEMNREAEKRVWFESALRKALSLDEFFLHYQPIVDVQTQRLAGAEALVRWKSQERGMIPPDTFIDIAESCGLIVPLGEWILRQAAADMAVWDRLGLTLERLSVNVSAVQFRSPSFHTLIERLFREQPKLRNRLCLEITENVFLDGGDELSERMLALHDKGIGFSLDDFGTGYSSLGYLKRFPVDDIKIDRSFIRDVLTDREDAALCEAILAMAHRLGLHVVAEGVENRDQLAFLVRNGCDKAQGYYFGKPMPPNEFRLLMEAHLSESRQLSG